MVGFPRDNQTTRCVKLSNACVGTSGKLAETLELCPASKLLYGSDAIGIPELFWLGAHRWRQALAAALPDEDLGALVLQGNARRLYKLSE